MARHVSINGNWMSEAAAEQLKAKPTVSESVKKDIEKVEAVVKPEVKEVKKVVKKKKKSW